MKLEKGKVYKNDAMPGYVFAMSRDGDKVMVRREASDTGWEGLQPEIFMAVKHRFHESGVMLDLTPQDIAIMMELSKIPAMIQKGEQIEKPPLGLIPRNIWIENRISDISAAIVRYAEAGKEIPMEWIDERNELISQLKEEE